MRYRLSLGAILLWLFAAAVMAFLLAPLVTVATLSFAPDPTTVPTGFSTVWYEQLWAQESWLRSLANSLIVATVASLIATVLGTMAAMGLARARFRGRTALLALILAPMVVPSVILATGGYLFFLDLDLGTSRLALALIHAVLGVPFVVVTVSANLAGLDPRLHLAAASMGARPWYGFRRVTLPLIAPGIVTGAFFAFVASFDEVVVALFLTGPAERTLPRQMFESMRDGPTPMTLAAGSVLIALALLLLLSAELLRRSARRRSMPD